MEGCRCLKGVKGSRITLPSPTLFFSTSTLDTNDQTTCQSDPLTKDIVSKLGDTVSNASSTDIEQPDRQQVYLTFNASLALQENSEPFVPYLVIMKDTL